MKKIILSVVFLLLLNFYAFAGDYVIDGGDQLDISVWGNPELSVKVEVRSDGKISIPALGDIKAAGYTPMELTEIIKKELGKMVKTPIVTVIVTRYTNYRIYVFGRGVDSDVRLLHRDTTLLQFLAQLGPLAEADLASAYLVRNKKKIKENFLDIYEKGEYEHDILLEPNDMIFIPDNFEKRISVVGAVAKPTTMNYREGLTLLDVILSSGGFTQFAKEKAVQILRKNDDGTRSEITVNAKALMKGDMDNNMLIQPGDTVVVRENLF